MNFKNKKPTTLLCFGAGFVMVVLFMLFFYYHIDNELVETEVENIRLNANQQQAAIDGAIKAHATNLKSMSRTLQIIAKSEQATAEYLQNIEKNLGIDTVIVADDAGVGRLSNLRQVDVIDNEAYQWAMQGESYVTAPTQSRFSGKTVLIAATPMLSDEGTVMGAVLVEYSLEFITRTLISLVDEADEKGYSIILGRKGHIITSTSYRDEHTRPFRFAEFADGLTYEALLKKIDHRKHEGGFL